MAMTLRLTEEQDAVLTALADAAGVSKQKAVDAARRYDALLERVSQ